MKKVLAISVILSELGELAKPIPKVSIFKNGPDDRILDVRYMVKLIL